MEGKVEAAWEQRCSLGQPEVSTVQGAGCPLSDRPRKGTQDAQPATAAGTSQRAGASARAGGGSQRRRRPLPRSLCPAARLPPPGARALGSFRRRALPRALRHLRQFPSGPGRHFLARLCGSLAAWLGSWERSFVRFGNGRVGTGGREGMGDGEEAGGAGAGAGIRVGSGSGAPAAPPRPRRRYPTPAPSHTPLPGLPSAAPATGANRSGAWEAGEASGLLWGLGAA